MNRIIKKIVLPPLYILMRAFAIAESGLLVVTYHRICDKPDLDDTLKVSQITFEKQIEYLQNKYNIISGEELEVIAQGKKVLRPNSCMITFDDGWSDNYHLAFPILKKYHVPAIIFLSADFIGTHKIFWHERLAEWLMRADITDFHSDNNSELKPYVANSIAGILAKPTKYRRPYVDELVESLKQYRNDKIENMFEDIGLTENGIGHTLPAMLSWEQVREMSAHGIEFGSHGSSHNILTLLSEAEVEKELITSAEIIERNIGKKPRMIAYPNGNYNNEILKIAEASGYIFGFTCNHGINTISGKCLTIKRRHIGEDVTLGFNHQFSQLFFEIELSGARDYLIKWKQYSH